MSSDGDGKVTELHFDIKASHGWIVLLKGDRVLCDVCVCGEELGVQIRHFEVRLGRNTTKHIATSHLLLAQPDCLERVIDLLRSNGL